MNPLLGIGLAAATIAWLFSDDEDNKMPAVQQHFEDFHDRIKLYQDDERAKLREKRDTLLSALKEKLADDVPKFEHFDQGSYSMHTGILPLDGNYDIDVGVIFDCKKDKYPDPVVLKKKVRDALDTHGRTVAIRRPCVTVNYMRGEQVDYHVDLAIYAKRDDGKLDIAKGKENSSDDNRVWELSDPKQLTTLICERFADSDEREQYRRCIRYIKRWRDVQFANGGAPLSIALTVAAYSWFQPHFETSGKAGDLQAMLSWTKKISSQFTFSLTDEGAHDRLKVTLPVSPHADLMAGLTKLQMETFKQKLDALEDALSEAYNEDLPEDACKKLQKQFGDDFKVPEKSQTAKTVTAPVISTGSSA